MEQLIILIGSFLIAGGMLFTIIRAGSIAYRRQQISKGLFVFATVSSSIGAVLLAGLLPLLFSLWFE
ncbi:MULTISPECIES: hypothetical protein [Exiguobacterium]|uniref:Uncharacterized protein n=1 Tax=Exiguobacterium oxidotolerans TaxID=223958 RepID=A0A653IHW3_9BACL|nr:MULTISPECIES: hypothetical protein [Exiguobacterium]ASI35270.1 hypothetical protein A0126_06720 [Exiguobacterium sp. N4-1P]ASI37283.1 hypothetical protein A0126_16995 [Exiguobacterium sp. N4-1P]VWX38746.1 conserved hypothetical protein [Exiguobacterium oxidotolerans]